MKHTTNFHHTMNAKKRNLFLVTAGILSMLILFSCEKDNNNVNPFAQIKPSKPTPPWGSTLTPQMQTVIEALDTIATIPLQTLTPQQARQQPTAADAAMRVMSNYHIPLPPMNVDTTGREISVTGGTIHIRIYTPRTGKTSYPVIVYYHGGGWVIATIDTYNASAQALAEQADAIVISVEYRKAPDYKFPTAHNDCYMAYKWAMQNASSINADSNKIALAGESAGGNLAVAVAMMARDSSIKMPLYLVALYPIASYDFATSSYNQYAEAKPLNKPLMQWFFNYYLSSPSEGASPLISLVNANLSGLPPTTIINAEIDPLQTEGGMLADKLQAAGVAVMHRVYAGVTHEFFGMASVIPEAKDAQSLAASGLKSAFKK